MKLRGAINGFSSSVSEICRQCREYCRGWYWKTVMESCQNKYVASMFRYGAQNWVAWYSLCKIDVKKHCALYAWWNEIQIHFFMRNVDQLTVKLKKLCSYFLLKFMMFELKLMKNTFKRNNDILNVQICYKRASIRVKPRKQNMYLKEC